MMTHTVTLILKFMVMIISGSNSQDLTLTSLGSVRQT
jgi:hypothetical protein